MNLKPVKNQTSQYEEWAREKSQKSYIPNLKNGALRRKNGKFDWLKIEGKISYFNLQTPKSCIILEIFYKLFI